MTDRRASSEGFTARPRPPFPPSEGLQDHSEEQTTLSTSHSTASGPRRRSTRSKASPTESPNRTPQPWPDTERGEARKAKGGRSITKKAPEEKVNRHSANPGSSNEDLGSSEKDAVGFLPRLGRLLEGKENKAPRQRKDSVVSEIQQQSNPHRQTTKGTAVPRSILRQKHGSLQRNAELLGSLPNPSLQSVLSSLTTQTTSSSGSNSTITQKSFDKNHVSKPRPTKPRKRLQSKRTPTKSKETAMDPLRPSTNVFQYLNTAASPEPYLNRPQSSSSSTVSDASDATSIEDDRSSVAGGAEAESPMTSPSCVRRPIYEESAQGEDRSSDTGASVRESGLESHAEVDHHDQSDEEEEDSSEEENEDDHDEQEQEHEHENEHHQEELRADEDDESDDSDDNDDNEEHEGGHHDAGPHEEHLSHTAHGYALERTAPPRVPSSSSSSRRSHRSDRHFQRLRDQERELRDHVLQPQPHRDFQFLGAPSPSPHPSMSAFYPDSHGGASHVSFHGAPPHAPGWPPPVHPPPPIGYYSPPQVVPGLNPDTSHAMAARSHMATTSAAVQPPPFHHLYTQPPHYQQHPTGPDLTKTTVVGYELLADKLTELQKEDNDNPKEGRVVPMYRKFEQLNHRILLHLQDEISELEDDLRYIDECIAQATPGGGSGHIQPASRRGEARSGNELHYRRTDLLGRIYLKLGQYNSALSSFSTMKRNLDPADAEDIQAYQSWIEKHAPVEKAETRFLEKTDDLLSLQHKKPTSIVGGVGLIGLHQYAAIGLPLILVLPLMAFALIPGLLGRLFIIGLIGAVEVGVVSSSAELMGFMTVKEWIYCASIYFGVLAVLAGVCV